MYILNAGSPFVDSFYDCALAAGATVQHHQDALHPKLAQVQRWYRFVRHSTVSRGRVGGAGRRGGRWSRREAGQHTARAANPLPT